MYPHHMAASSVLDHPTPYAISSRLINISSCRPTTKETGSHTNMQTDSQTDRQTDRQGQTHYMQHTYIYICYVCIYI